MTARARAPAEKLRRRDEAKSAGRTHPTWQWGRSGYCRDCPGPSASSVGRRGRGGGDRRGSGLAALTWQPVDSRKVVAEPALRAEEDCPGPEETETARPAPAVYCLPGQAAVTEQRTCRRIASDVSVFLPVNHALFPGNSAGEGGQQVSHRPTHWLPHRFSWRPLREQGSQPWSRQTVRRPLTRPTTNSTRAITSRT